MAEKLFDFHAIIRQLMQSAKEIDIPTRKQIVNLTLKMCNRKISKFLHCVFADRVYYHVVALFSTPDICLHRGTASNVGIQYTYFVPRGSSTYCHSCTCW